MDQIVTKQKSHPLLSREWLIPFATTPRPYRSVDCTTMLQQADGLGIAGGIHWVYPINSTTGRRTRPDADPSMASPKDKVPPGKNPNRPPEPDKTEAASFENLYTGTAPSIMALPSCISQVAKISTILPSTASHVPLHAASSCGCLHRVAAH